MIRRLFLLNGLAIIAVVANHAAYWGFTAMFWWADLFYPVTSLPNFDQMGTLPYYGLISVIKLAEFSVPSFLFVTGFFFVYAFKGETAWNWKVIGSRLLNVLIPYLIWSVIIFLSEGLEGCLHGCQLASVGEYLKKLLLGQAAPAYYYIPLICQFYLLAPLLVQFAKTHGKLLLVVAAVIQLTAKVLLYLRFFGVDVYGADIITMPQLFVNAIFYVALGVVVGFHLSELKLWLARVKWFMLAGVITFGILSIFEGEYLYRANLNREGYAALLSTTLYAVSFILCFLAFENVTIPYSKAVYQLGSKSYGIYLLHQKALELGARTIYHLAPLVMTYQILFQPLLIILGVGLPILFMTLVSKSPLRNTYRYLFG